MAKFGKKLERKSIAEYKSKYIKYKDLKKYIRNNKSLWTTEIKKTKIQVEEQQINTLIKDFKTMLNDSFIITFTFFKKKEKEILSLINTHLHIRDNYNKLTKRGICQEIVELKNISVINYQLTQFITLNITAVIKILKKFDKKFRQFKSPLSENFFTERKAELGYAFKFEIIDQAQAIIDDLIEDLVSSKNLIFPEEDENHIKTANSFEYAAIQENLIDVKEEDIDKMILDNRKIITESINKGNELIRKFKIKYKKINSIVKRTNVFFDDESVSCKVNPVSINSEGLFIDDSRKNHNIKVILLHHFLSSISYYIILPNFSTFFIKREVEEEKQVKEKNFDYINMAIFAMVPLSKLIFRIPKKLSYKGALILSLFSLIIGNAVFGLGAFLYFFYGVPSCKKKILYICLMIIGRAIYGFGMIRDKDKEYLIENIPKGLFSQYMLFFKLLGLSGNALGPLICLAFYSLFEKHEKIHFYFAGPSFFCSAIYVLLFLVVLVVFQKAEKAEKDYPKENAKSSSSFSIPKVDELGQNISINDNYLIIKSIEQISWKEQATSNSLYRSTITILALVFFSNTINYLLLLFISLYYDFDLNEKRSGTIKEDVFKIISLDFSFIFVGVLLSYFIYRIFLMGRIKDRFIVIWILIMMIVLYILPLLLDIKHTTDIKHAIIQREAYIVFLGTIIVLNCLLRDASLHLFSKIIPIDYKVFKMKADKSLSVMTCLGQVMGCILYYIFLLKYKLGLIVTPVLMGIALVFVIFNIKTLKENAKARVIRSKKSRKYKMSEF